MYTNAEIASLIEENQVSRLVYTDQEIFDLEMERVFGRAWVYIGHESQIPNPGCFVTTDIGTQALILIRDDQRRVRIFYNRCPHRGARMLVNHTGQITKLVCHFHSYSFNTDGSISGIPLEDTYEDSEFKSCIKMREVVDIESYRGFIFTRLTPAEMDLKTWLGDTRATIDNFVDRSPEGEVEVVGPPYRWINACNWKMLSENVVDGAHVTGTHISTGQTAAKLAQEYEQRGEPVPPILEMGKSFWQSRQFIREMGTTVLPNGHSYNGGKVSLHSEYSEVVEYNEAMEKAYGKTRCNEILSQQRHNTCFYPNMNMKTMIQKMRVFKPISPDKTIVEGWVFRLKGAPDELLQRTLTYAEMTDSPATLLSTDDTELIGRMQTGLKSNAYQMVSMYRGQNRPRQQEGDAVLCEGDSEFPYLKQFETWKKLMCEETL